MNYFLQVLAYFIAIVVTVYVIAFSVSFLTIKIAQILNKLFLYLLPCILLIGCENKDSKVEQFIDRDGSVESGTAMITIVWYNGNIIKSYVDDVDLITDSLVLARRKQGEEILKIVIKLK